MDIKSKTFEQVTETIKSVANIHIMLHDRRLDFLRTKRDNMAHNKFLRILEQKIDQTDCGNWSRDKLVATLFLTFADIEMSKVVTGLFSKDRLDMVELRAQIRGLKSTPW